MDIVVKHRPLSGMAGVIVGEIHGRQRSTMINVLGFGDASAGQTQFLSKFVDQ